MVGLWGLASTLLPAEDEVAALRAELDQVQAERARLESTGSLHDPVRWQQRQRAEYDVLEIAELRVRVKSLEKSLLEKRAALRERLWVHSSELRELQRAREAAYARLAEIGQQLALLDNEIRLAEQADPPSPEKVQSLRAERAGLAKAEQDARAAAEAVQQSFLEEQKNLVTRDPQAAALQAEIQALQEHFEQARREMNERIDALPESQETEAQRRERFEEVRRLRQREQELKARLAISE